MFVNLGARVLPLFDGEGNLNFDEARLPAYRQQWISSLPPVYEADPLPLLTPQDSVTLTPEYIAANYVETPVGLMLASDERVIATAELVPEIISSLPDSPYVTSPGTGGSVFVTAPNVPGYGGVVISPPAAAQGSNLQTPFGVDRESYARSLAPVIGGDDYVGDVVRSENSTVNEPQKPRANLVALALMALPFVLF